jgi:F-type H+-transporting ATPase subunit epsilon|tara:strand:+ start:140 stop:547 length:408 start_codon:yes stop_codon:yes gene_type:complete
MKTFLLEIVSPEKLLFSQEVESVVAPAAEGMIGILTGHSPFLSSLRPGEIKVKSEGWEHFFVTTGGFMEVLPEKTVLLVESSEKADKIDKSRAKEARDRAQKRLQGSEEGIDKVRARESLERAEARLKVAEKHQS